MVALVRILFSSVTGHGHIYPLLPLAVAARDAGHDVAFATGESFQPTMRALGFTPAVVGRSIGEYFASVLTKPRAEYSGEELTELASTVFGEIMPRDIAAQITPVIQDFRPDLVVHESGNPGAALAARSAGVPGVCHGFGKVGPGLLMDRLRESLVSLAEELEVPLPTGAIGSVGNPYLDICPLSLQDKDFVASVERLPLRPVPFCEPGPLPEVARSERDRPLIYLTLGTAFGEATVLRHSIDALSSFDADTVVAVGPSVDAATLGDVPENVHLESWVPQADLLPHVDLVVHHGGSGTTLGTFGVGVPQLLLPQGADQFSNAEMVVEAGTGLQLLKDDIGVETIAARARDLLERDEFRVAAKVIADEIADMPAPEEIARRLPDFAGTS
jgi:UDP:flavonoid glycosyltransferase YjiC (YdhE family)